MTEQFTFGGDIVWRPTWKHIEHANLTAFMRMHEIKDFDALMQRSTREVAWFTDAILKYLDIQFYKPYTKVVDLSNGIQFPKWCADGTMNIVHNCVDKRRGAGDGSRKAVVFEGEEGIVKTLTYEELYKEVNKTANALRSLGLGKGDAIGIFMPMTPEIVIATCHCKDRRNYFAAILRLWRGRNCFAPCGCGCESTLCSRRCLSARKSCEDEICCG